MKKFIMMITALVGVLCMTSNVYADSPVTSTYFSRAYYDVDIVEEASRRNTITADMAEYLADSSNPIDIKAAIINALSWDTSGKSNAEHYCQMIYHKGLDEIDPASLSGDQQFCIGYLLAMDDIYFATTQSVDYLRMARDNMKDSLTVAIITFLVETMNGVSYDWQEQLNTILSDTNLNQDMSEAAIKEITNYMTLGIDSPVNITKTGDKSMGAVYGIVSIILLVCCFRFINKKGNIKSINGILA